MLSCIEKWTDACLEKVTRENAGNEAVDKKSAHNLAGEDPLVDERVIEQLIRDTSAEIVPELLNFYIKESENLMAKILEAKNNRDAQALEFETHTLGSSSASHANIRLHKVARKIEHYCREKEFEKAFALVDELKDLAIESFDELKSHADDIKTGYH
jgi:pentatricopeptide repeat protein